MKTFPLLLGLLALALSPLVADEKQPAAAPGNVKNVTPDEAEKLLKENPKTIVLDVRTPEEFASGHIPGATNVDFLGDDFAKKVGALDPSTPILVHCAGGGRSSRSLAELKDKKIVYHLNEGFKAWEKAGKPVEGAAKK
ncbi:MAG: rhodanese-like domain-containing protein [Chthoniobacteraceae bacterium]